MSSSTKTECGFFNWYPKFLQRFANTRSFIAIYGLLGIFQAMGYIYFVITLQTIEKRFKIPSQTTGIILSGNEISQILLSVILAYIGGNSNRPRFISIGVIFCALSCFILAMPHFIYGAGEDALKLTKEYVESSNISTIDHSIVAKMEQRSNRLCIDEPIEQQCDDEIESILPLILIFLSQFVLGIGNTLYYALGQTYLDDGVTKKKNTPLFLACVFSLRTIGPLIGFALGFACLKIYIDPTLTPIIDSKDPRWMGAYWLGWVFIGIAQIIVAILIGLFPRELPKKQAENENLRDSKEVPKILKSNHDLFSEESLPLKGSMPHNEQILGSINDFRSLNDISPTLENLPATLIRLFKNKLLMYNTLSGIFYILGASAFITFMSKYLEVQFHRSAADATIITGPFTLVGMVLGFLISGIVITKKKPSPSKLLMWNVIVGCMYMAGEVIYLFLTCPDGQIPMDIVNGRLNLSSTCNTGCHCAGISYTPVCLEETGDTFFSPCVASCKMYSKQKRAYFQCDCAKYHLSTLYPSSTTKMLTTSPPFITSDLPYSSLKPKVNSTNITESILQSTESNTLQMLLNKFEIQNSTQDDDYDNEDQYFTIETPDDMDPNYIRVRRSMSGIEESESTTNKEEDEDVFWGRMTPGACITGCAIGFYSFSIISSIINFFGTSGRIGNILVNFRCVSVKDKSVTQGLILMLVSLFALIPGPIIFGRIIDETCLVWTEQCSGRKGNCQLYDQKLFRYYVNLTALMLTSIGVFFDILVWKHGKNLDLYGEREEELLQRQEKKNNYVKN
ncbi:hypothetical protein PVAND_005940 [Polypedilum vanderplanki]|uniref:Solute carrier organic anion transporter family member n=1 Tax=Polypedilum vanderplanki TaxID=319348 RepID=A0A9J6C3I3_POLVA|nr:hypothetical protein PVAND_005940 [Polypedilum vanderplanki]